MDVTDPSLFMFTKISIDSGRGVASLSSSSSSFSHKLFLISSTNVSVTTRAFFVSACLKLFLSSVKMEATLRSCQSLCQALIIHILAD